MMQYKQLADDIETGDERVMLAITVGCLNAKQYAVGKQRSCLMEDNPLLCKMHTFTRLQHGLAGLGMTVSLFLELVVGMQRTYKHRL